MFGAGLLFGCGGDSGSGPSPTPTPVPVRNVIVEDTFTGLQPFDPTEEVALLAFVTGQTGTLDVTVDWTFDSNDIDFGLVRGTLEEALSPACEEDTPDCPLEIVMTAATLTKPEVMTVPNLPAGNYIVVVVNFGETEDSGVVVVGLTS
jgi:hypothetical protein